MAQLADLRELRRSGGSGRSKQLFACLLVRASRCPAVTEEFVGHAQPHWTGGRHEEIVFAAKCLDMHLKHHQPVFFEWP